MYFTKKVNQHVIPRYGVILRYKDEYLIVHQICSGYFGFSKGVLEYKENIITGCVRELQEETNIKIHPSVLTNAQIIRVHFKNTRHHYFIIDVNYKYKAIPNDIQEISECSWVKLEELKTKNTAIFTKLVIKKLETLEIEKKIEKQNHFNNLIKNLH